MYIQTKSTTILQYVNFINDKPIDRMQYALNYFRQRVSI